MTPVKISFSGLDPLKWNTLVNDQEGNVPFYDWATLESRNRTKEDPEFVALVLEDAGNYLMALPGTERNGKFNNYFFRTFDNLDVLIKRNTTAEQRKVFIQFIFDSYEGILLRNFNSSSILFRDDLKFLQGPSRKCPYMELPADPENIFPVINRSFKKTLRWNLNGIPKLGITTEFLTGNNAQQVFEKEFMPAHENRMLEKKINSGFAETVVQEYFRKINSHPQTGVLLTLARQNGTFIGGIYGICNPNTYAYIASGIRADIEKYSLGQFLIFKTMEYLTGKHCRRFDFLRGTETYKSLWTKDYEVNESRYYYKNSKVISVFLDFLEEHKKRYGRLKCFKVLLQSWFRPVRKIH